MKLLKEKYKTREGANKRLSFERAMNPGEYARGDVTSRSSFSIVEQNGFFRVARETKP